LYILSPKRGIQRAASDTLALPGCLDIFALIAAGLN
jgi:hypothetical protein